MRKVKLFEEYIDTIHKKVSKKRKFHDTKLGSTITKIKSFIDDITDFNFDMISHNLKNNTGYDKLQKLVNELNIVKLIVDRTNGEVDFEDLYRYGVDDKVLLYLCDDDVQEYLKKDSMLLNKLSTHECVTIFTQYSKWKNSNGLNESFEFKTIHYYMCSSCSNLCKSKDGIDTCPECGSDRLDSMNEVDWYKQAD